MALSSNQRFLEQMYNNRAQAKLKSSLLAEPVLMSDTVQANIPWKYEKLALEDTFVFGEKKTITFKLPRDGLIDPRSLRLSFNARAVLKSLDGTSIGSAPLGHTAEFCFDINSIFSECNLLVGRSQILHKQPGYNLFSRTISKFANELQMNLSSRGLFSGMGISTAFSFSGANNGRLGYHSSRNVSTGNQGLEVSRRYMVPINMGLFLQQKPIYLDAFNESLQIEFVLDKADIAVWTSLTVATAATLIGGYFLEVGYPKLHYTRYLPSPQLKAEINLMVRSNKLNYQYVMWDHSRFSLPSSVMKHTVQIPISRKWLKHSFAVLRCELDNTLAFNKFRTYSSLDPSSTNGASFAVAADRRYAKQSAIRRYFWKYNSQIIPEKGVDVITPHPRVQAVDINGASVVDANNANTLYPVTTIDDTFQTPGVEAWYFIEQLFLRNKEMQLSICRPAAETVLLPVEISPAFSLSAGGEEATGADQKFIGSGGSVTGRLCNEFMMVGLFSESTYDGTVKSLSGGCENDTLELHIEYNGISENAAPPQMFLDVFTAYDNILSIHENGYILVQ
jgi:hypothetical protein